MSNGSGHKSLSHNSADQDVSTSLSNMQMGVACKFVPGHGQASTVSGEGNSTVSDIVGDAPLTVKQHFQQQRKQQKSRARDNRRDVKKQILVNPAISSASLSTSASSRSEKKVKVNADQQISHPTRALSEPAFFYQPHSHQARPSTSKSADQEILLNTNMKVDPRLIGGFDADGYSQVCGAASSKDCALIPTKTPVNVGDDSALESSLSNIYSEASLQVHDPLFRIQRSKIAGEKLDDVHVQSEILRQDLIHDPLNKCENSSNQIEVVHLNDNSKLDYGSVDFCNVYSSVGDMDAHNVHSESGMVVVNGTLEQGHVDADPTTFDQGVEKLDTETDERFLSWLYCENEHAEDDNAEYTRVLEEIEKDECNTNRMEDIQGQDCAMPTCMPSTSYMDGFRKIDLDFTNSLTADSTLGNYSSISSTVPTRDVLPESYTMTDFESDLELDVMPIKEDEDILYGRLLDVLVRDIKLLTYNNAALVDEVSRLNYAIFVASEERKVLARRSCHHDRNRIRRLQTANKRKCDAQRRQQEQLTIAETQENIAQIKAKMAKTAVSPQKVVPSMCNDSSCSSLDVAAIKRSVEAEQRALEDNAPSKKTTRKAASSRFQRKRYDHSRSEKKRGYTQNTAKRGREQFLASSEDIAHKVAERVNSSRKFPRNLASIEQDDQDRKRRKSSQMCRSQGEGNPAEVVVDSLKYATGSLIDNQTHHEDAASEEAYSTVINDENEMDRSDGLHSWRRRADRPPARAASAAAQTLLAAELAASVETPTYSVRRANRSRSNTSEPNNIRQSRRRVAPPSQNIHEQRLENSDQMAELTVDVSDEAAIEDDLDLDSKYEVLDEELVPIRDVAGCEVVSTKTPQRLRSIRKPTRTCSRQSGCDVGEEAELTQQGLSSSLPYEASEKSEEPVSMATRSGLHGCF